MHIMSWDFKLGGGVDFSARLASLPHNTEISVSPTAAAKCTGIDTGWKFGSAECCDNLSRERREWSPWVDVYSPTWVLVTRRHLALLGRLDSGHPTPPFFLSLEWVYLCI